MFGQLQEKAGTSTMKLENVSSLDEVKEIMTSKYPFLGQMKYLVALNQEVVRGNAELKDEDEIAIMPPFAGG